MRSAGTPSPVPSLALGMCHLDLGLQTQQDTGKGPPGPESEATQEGDLRGKWQPWRWGPRDLSLVLSPSSLSFCRDGRRQRPSSTGERREGRAGAQPGAPQQGAGGRGQGAGPAQMEAKVVQCLSDVLSCQTGRSFQSLGESVGRLG